MPNPLPERPLNYARIIAGLGDPHNWRYGLTPEFGVEFAYYLYMNMPEPPRPARFRDLWFAGLRKTRQPTPPRRTKRVTERKLPFAYMGYRP